MNNDTGIYAIVSPSGRMYIGSAVSFARRWARHRHHLRRGDHHSPALQNAWNKHGEGALVFKKIALCPITDLIVVEQAFIDSLKPKYNVCPIAGNRLSTKHSLEARQKMSIAHSGKKRGTPSAETCLKISLGNTGKRRTEEDRAGMSIRRKGAGNPRARAVICIETSSRFATGLEASEWLRSIGLSKALKSAISMACSGKRKSAYGYRWRYSD